MVKGISKGQMVRTLASASGKIPPHVLAMIIGIPIAIGFMYFGVINPILKKTGLKDTAESKAEDKVLDLMLSGAYWSPRWYKENGGNDISLREAKDYAEQIEDAFGWVNDDEKSIYGVFEQLGSKGNISMVAEAYARINDGDSLISRMTSKLNDSELFRVAVIISNY